MIPEFAVLCLIFAFVFSSLLSLRPFVNKPIKLKPLVLGHMSFLLLSFLLLMASFVLNDFSVQYIFNHSNTKLYWWYRLTAIWSGHEGSMLLWVLVLSFWMVSLLPLEKKLAPRFFLILYSLLGVIQAIFILFILKTSNPFVRTFEGQLQEGLSLNPLLQDAGFLFHPPFLYLGYVGFAIPYVFALTALITQKHRENWIAIVKPYLMMAWCFLTLGIILGSWWAYRELGWGGYWFWDPVENASLMPWISATILIHVSTQAKRTPLLANLSYFFALLTFCLSLLGTFLVRSGVLISVHAFAASPLRGAYLLLFFGLMLIASLTVFLFKRPKVTLSQKYLSIKAFILLLGSLFLTTFLLSVCLGTVYPLLLSGLGLGQISIGAPYFNGMCMVLLTPAVLIMGFSGFRRIKSSIWQSFVHDHMMFALLSILLGLWLPLAMFADNGVWVFLGVSLSSWLGLQTLAIIWRKRLERVSLSMVMAHLGVALLVFSITINAHYQQEKNITLKQGQSMHIGPYQIFFDGIEAITTSHYDAREAHFSIYKAHRLLKINKPQLRFYQAQQERMPHTGISAFLFNDVYINLGNQQTDGSFAVQIQLKPFVRWIWCSGALMILGGMCSLVQKRRHYIKEYQKLSKVLICK